MVNALTFDPPWRLVVTESTDDLLADLGAVVDDVKPFVDEHYWLPLYGMGGASKAAGWKPQPGNPGRLDNMREPLPCWAVFTEAHVTVDGLLAACCFGSGLDGDLIMSDLKQHSFMEAWNSPAYQSLRRERDGIWEPTDLRVSIAAGQCDCRDSCHGDAHHSLLSLSGWVVMVSPLSRSRVAR